MSLLANDERGDYKQLPGGDDPSRRPAGDSSHTSGGTPPSRWLAPRAANDWVQSGRYQHTA